MRDVAAVGDRDVAMELGLHGIEVDDVVVAAIDALQQARLAIGQQRLPAVGPAVAVHHDEVVGRHAVDQDGVTAHHGVADTPIELEHLDVGTALRERDYRR